MFAQSQGDIAWNCVNWQGAVVECDKATYFDVVCIDAVHPGGVQLQHYRGGGCPGGAGGGSFDVLLFFNGCQPFGAAFFFKIFGLAFGVGGASYQC